MFTLTKYYGINIEEQSGKYWIVDESGGDKFFGYKKPTPEDVKQYRDDIIEGRGRQIWDI